MQQSLILLSCLVLLAACAPVNTSAFPPIDTSTPLPPPVTLTAEPTATPTPAPVAIPPAPQFIGNAAPSLPQSEVSHRIFQRGGNYVFEFDSGGKVIQYLYTPASGTLNDLRARIGESAAFLPFNYGGPYFVMDGNEVPPWDARVYFQLTHSDPVLTEDSLEITWEARSASETATYTYRFSMVGKTLRLQVDADTPNISEFTLDRSEETPGARLLYIPYLSTMDVLLYRDHFITAYFDWTESHASFVERLSGTFSDQSFYYGQFARYQPNTAGVRHPLHEVLYLTISDVFADVLPNIPNPPSPYRELLAGKVVVDLWDEENFFMDRDYLTTLKNRGITDLLIIEHTWQNCGYDNCYPDVMPARQDWGGDRGLAMYLDVAREAGYLVALHENYVDIYPNAPSWTPDVVALNPDGSQAPAWFNSSANLQSYLLSPARVLDFAAQFSPQIHARYGTTASFLDVHTAASPSYKVDFNAAVEGSARMSTTFTSYAQLLAYARAVHQGPVLGEGGHHFLYAGLVDGVEAQYIDDTHSGPDIPPVVDFSLLKIHPLMVNHGVGYYERYFARNGIQKWGDFTREEIYHYMATEIAFCHAGFAPAWERLGGPTQGADQVLREVTLVLPIQKLCALSTPTRILYQVNGELVGVERALIADQAWQVFVEYDSGLRVYVNRHATDNWEVAPDTNPSWVNYSALIDGQRRDYVGGQGLPAYTLPPGGWLAYVP